MTLDKLNLLCNVGKFDNASSTHILTAFTVIYAENGRGKTTLASILRSLQLNKPSLINDRKRLGKNDLPHVVVTSSETEHVFKNGSWNVNLSNLAIFDDTFVAENVCLGIELQSSHRQNLHGLIIGSEGVQLDSELRSLVDKIEQHNKDLKEKANDIPDEWRNGFEVDDFCNLEQDQEIDTKINVAQQALDAARSAQAIGEQPDFTALTLPEFDVATIEDTLRSGLANVETSAMQQVQEHFNGIGEGGEAWVADGMSHTGLNASKTDPNHCPFCAQGLENSPLISHYQAYFSADYEALKASIKSVITNIETTHSGDIQIAFERDVQTASQAQDFWARFMEMRTVEIDSTTILANWNTARDLVLQSLRAKLAGPLESAVLLDTNRQAITTYHERCAEVSALSVSLQALNAQIEKIKAQAAAANVEELGANLERVSSIKRRFEAEAMPACNEYLAKKNAKKVTEEQRKVVRQQLDNYRANMFPAFEEDINKYLGNFNAGFRLNSVEPRNIKRGSTVSYNISINNQDVDVSAGSGPSFRNTLSAGDRNALALAWFFTSIDRDPDIAQKIVIIDDPMTSLDEHRSFATVDQIYSLAERVSQIVVLSHSKPFLCGLWEGANKSVRSAYYLGRVGNGSAVSKWDVTADLVTQNDKNSDLVNQCILQETSGDKHNVASALRPMLEAFLRVAYPSNFVPGSLLGPFINTCRQRLGGNDELLSEADVNELNELVRYTNKFHHDTNPERRSATPNDGELLGFARRVVTFTSRRPVDLLR